MAIQSACHLVIPPGKPAVHRANRGSQTPHALAERLGWSQTKIAAIDGGTRRLYLHEMPEICRAFGVTLTRLLQDGDPDDLQALGL
jgi:hypothetical protein